MLCQVIAFPAKFQQIKNAATALGLVKNGEDFEGMYRQHLAHHASESMTIQDQATADRLNKMAEEQGLTTKFQVGDRVNIAWTGEGDNIRLTLAKAEAGASREQMDLSKITKGDRISEDISLDDLKALRNNLAEMGYTKQYLEPIDRAIQAMQQRGLKAAHVEITKPSGSKDIATMNIRAGNESLVTNKALTETGYENIIKALNIKNKGIWVDDRNKNYTGNVSENYDVNTRIIGHGTKIDPNTAFQMALNGDLALVKPVTNPFLSDKLREAEIAALSSRLGRAAAELMNRLGISADFSRVNVHLSVGAKSGIILKALGGVTGELGGFREDSKTTNLMVQQYDTLIRNTLKEAQSKGLTVEQTRELLSSRIENYTNALYMEVQANAPEKFGFSSPGAALTELGKSGLPHRPSEGEVKKFNKAMGNKKYFEGD